ncbi:MAG: hypothetical protein AAFX81_18010 [Pseudomonadota bacterium]
MGIDFGMAGLARLDRDHKGRPPRSTALDGTHRDQVREAVETTLSWRPRPVVVGRGECYQTNAAAALRLGLALTGAAAR